MRRPYRAGVVAGIGETGIPQGRRMRRPYRAGVVAGIGETGIP